jgi:hypothetical protein
MGWQGALVVFERWIDPSEFDMSTAIVRSYHQDGFVVMADGRRTDTADPSVVIDTTQKIFDLSDGNNQIACSIAGVAIINGCQSNEAILDLGSEVLKGASALSGQRFRDMFEFGIQLARPINILFSQIKAGKKLRQYPSLPPQFGDHGSAIAFLYLDGFFDGVPSRVGITFLHKDQTLIDPHVVAEPVSIGARDIMAPRKIIKLVLHSPDPRFEAYRPTRGHCGSLDDEVTIFKNFILACSDPEALKIDARCAGIGGHIHAATITLAKGFRWVPGFEPARPARC